MTPPSSAHHPHALPVLPLPAALRVLPCCCRASASSNVARSTHPRAWATTHPTDEPGRAGRDSNRPNKLPRANFEILSAQHTGEIIGEIRVRQSQLIKPNG